MPNCSMTDATIHPDAVLQELHAHQQLAAAVHHTLENLLPTAAGHVENATYDVTQSLMNLAMQVSAQQELLQTTLLMASRKALSEEETQEIASESALLSYDIAQRINAMITGLQFQDRNSQLMHHAVAMLRACEPMHVPIEPTMVVRLGSIARARKMLAGVSIHEVREQLVVALEHFRVIPRKSKLPSDGVDHSVELF